MSRRVYPGGFLFALREPQHVSELSLVWHGWGQSEPTRRDLNPLNSKEGAIMGRIAVLSAIVAGLVAAPTKAATTSVSVGIASPAPRGMEGAMIAPVSILGLNDMANTHAAM